MYLKTHSPFPRSLLCLGLLLFATTSHAVDVVDGVLSVDSTEPIVLEDGDNLRIEAGVTLATEKGEPIYTRASGNNHVIHNAGTIKAPDAESTRGIYTAGENDRITNSGDVIAKGQYARGIYTGGSRASITNSGHVTVEGKLSRGIYSGGDHSSVINSGVVTVNGEESRGINIEGDHSRVINSGTITVDGVKSNGILVDGSNNTITNSGTISVADLTNVHAISASPGSTGLTLNIEPGSRIIGRIDLGGGAEMGTERDTLNINDPTPTRLVVENVEIVNLNVDGFMQVEGTTTTITVVRPPTATAGRALSALSSALQGVSQQRLDHNRALGLTLSNARHFQARAPLLWGQVFGGSEQVDGKDTALAYDLTQQGFSIGYERDYRGRRLGLFGGVATSNSESAVQSFAQETSSTYFGAYAHFNLGDFNLATALIAGTDRHDSERLFVGSNLKGAETETAKADFNGWFLSPSVSLSSVYDLNDQVELRPSIRLDYSLANRAKYTESGTTDANLTIGSRSLSAFTAQLQVAAVYHLNPGMDLTAHLGFSSSRFSEDDIEASLEAYTAADGLAIKADSIRYKPVGDDSSSGLIAGLGLRTSLNDRLKLAAGVALEGEHLGYHLNLEYGF